MQGFPPVTYAEIKLSDAALAPVPALSAAAIAGPPQGCATCNTVVRGVYAGEICKLPCVVAAGGDWTTGVPLCNFCETSAWAIGKVMVLALEMTAALSLPGCAECLDGSGAFCVWCLCLRLVLLLVLPLLRMCNHSLTPPFLQFLTIACSRWFTSAHRASTATQRTRDATGARTYARVCVCG